MRPYSSVLVAVVVAAIAPSARAACEITDPTPTGALPTLMKGQSFRFVATDDCEGLTFRARGVTLNPDTAGRVGPNRHRYAVGIPAWQWRDFENSPLPTFQWTVSGTSGGVVTRVTTTNEMDVDGDGWTRTQGDLGACDHAPAVNPAAEDTCGNGIDDDCDGVTDNCGLDDPDTTIRTFYTGAELGLPNTLAVGDVDGDGIADVEISSITNNAGTGAVYVAHGPVARGTIEVQTLPAVTGNPPKYLGVAISTGDHDLDGVDDILAAAAGTDRALLFLGPTVADRQVEDADANLTADWPSTGRDDVALIGDADGDGVPDAVFGAPDADVDAAGRAYLASGPLSGAVRLETDSTYTFTAGSSDQLGVSTTRVGDLTGDGIEEIAVGNNAGFTGLRSVYFFEGGIAPGTYDAASSAWATLTPETKVSDIGDGALVADDYDGDGALDLLVGDREARSSAGHYSGVVYGFLGPFSGGALGAATADVFWEATPTGINLGTAVAAGDIDGDDALDVIMGAPSDAGPGWAYVQQGFTTGTVDVATLRRFTGPEVLDNFGSSITVIPDWTGDGVPEIAIGATRVNDYAGAVYVFESDDLF